MLHDLHHIVCRITDTTTNIEVIKLVIVFFSLVSSAWDILEDARFFLLSFFSHHDGWCSGGNINELSQGWLCCFIILSNPFILFRANLLRFTGSTIRNCDAKKFFVDDFCFSTAATDVSLCERGHFFHRRKVQSFSRTENSIERVQHVSTASPKTSRLMLRNRWDLG